ncbi:MAG: hypothetical protein V3W34_20660 [Phycisphaerae bacterium]
MAFAADDAVTADLDSDGTVGILDLLTLLANWGCDGLHAHLDLVGGHVPRRGIHARHEQAPL